MTYGPPPNQNWQRPPQPPPGPGYGPPPGPPPPGYGYQPGYPPQFGQRPARKPAPRAVVMVLGIMVTVFGLALIAGPPRPEVWVMSAVVVVCGVLILLRLRLGAILAAIAFFLFAGLVALRAFTPQGFYNPLAVPKVTGAVGADDDIGAYVFGAVALVLMVLCLLAPVLRALKPVTSGPAAQPSGPPPGWQGGSPAGR